MTNKQEDCKHKFTVAAYTIVCEYCGYKWTKLEE